MNFDSLWPWSNFGSVFRFARCYHGDNNPFLLADIHSIGVIGQLSTIFQGLVASFSRIPNYFQKCSPDVLAYYNLIPRNWVTTPSHILSIISPQRLDCEQILSMKLKHRAFYQNTIAYFWSLPFSCNPSIVWLVHDSSVGQLDCSSFLTLYLHAHVDLSGFQGPSCDDDINECQGQHGCMNGNCVNNRGSYTCDCQSGNV